MSGKRKMKRGANPAAGRRQFLRGAGVCIALPTLQSLLPKQVRAQAANKRLITIYHPNGTPQRRGDALIPGYLKDKFSAYAERMSVVRNMGNLKFYGESRPYFASAHLSNYFPLYRGEGVKPGSEAPTFDQMLAQDPAFASAPIPTISITLDPTSAGKHGGNPNHYNCLSWKGANAPVPTYTSPRALFDRLMGVTPPAVQPSPQVVDESQKRRLQQKRLYLDQVVGQINSIQAAAGSEDRRRLDEYLTGIEELDRKTQSLLEPSAGAADMPMASECNLGSAASDPSAYPQVQSLMQDLVVRAFQCGISKINTFMLAPPAGANFPLISYVPGLSVGRGWHPLSHWNSDHNISGASASAVYEDYKNVVGWHYDRTADFLSKLDAINEGDNTLLDNTLVCLGSSMAYGAHSSEHIYQVLLGGKGVIRHGQDIDAGLVTSGNLWSTVIQGFTGNAPRVGKSTGTISGLL